MSDSHFVILNSAVRFDGNCVETKPFCGAVCCKTSLVLLTDEERKSEKYDHITPTPDCNCRSCQTMRSAGRVAVRRKGTACVYLDGAGDCSIYDERPQQCRAFDCESTWYRLHPIGPEV